MYKNEIDLSKKETEKTFEVVSGSSYGRLGKVVGSGFDIVFYKDGSFLIEDKRTFGTKRNDLKLCDVTGGLYYFDPKSGSWEDCAPRNNGSYIFSTYAGEAMLFKLV